MDYHNPCEPSTTSCPYLPGQPVNVLEVPIQDEPDDSIRRPSTGSSSVHVEFTLNPEDKFLAFKPLKLSQTEKTSKTAEPQHSLPPDQICLPPQKQDVMGPLKVLNDLSNIPPPPMARALHGRKSSPISAPMSRRPSLWDLFRRDTKSAEEVKMDKQQALPADGILQLPSQRALGDTYDIANAPGSLHEPYPTSDQPSIGSPPSCHGSKHLPFESPQCQMPEACSFPKPLPADVADNSDKEGAEPGDFMSTFQKQLDRLAIQPTDYTSDKPLRHRKGRLPDTLSTAKAQATALQSFQPQEATPAKRPPNEYVEREVEETFQVAATGSSYTSSLSLSPTWSSVAFTETFSPACSAQAASPTISDLGGYFSGSELATSFSADSFAALKSPTVRYGSSIFDHAHASESNIYQLPEADGSVLTLRDLSTTKDRTRLSTPFAASNSNDLVEAWNDGSQEGVKTTFEEFFDDHSYLSTVIL